MYRRVCRRVLLASIGLLLVAAAPSDAQIPSGAETLCKASLPLASFDKELDKLRQTSNLRDINTRASAILREIWAALPASATCQVLPFDLKRRQYRLVWVSRDEQGKEAIAHHVVRTGSDEFLAQRLRGVSSERTPYLVDVFLTSLGRAEFRETLVATADANPDSARLAEVLEKAKLADALAFGSGNAGFASLAEARAAQGDLSREMLTLQDPAAADLTRLIKDLLPATGLTVQVLAPRLSVPRGRIDFRQNVDIGIQSDARIDQTQKLLADALSRLAAPERVCAQEALGQLAAAFHTKVLTNAACQAEVAAGDPGCALIARLTFDDTLQSVSELAACADKALATPVPMAAVAAFRALVAPRNVLGTSTLVNQPKTWWTLAAVSGVLMRPGFPSNALRAKIDTGGVLRVDPLPALVTGPVVNIHPLRFEASQRNAPTFGESWRVFAGPSVSPEPGLMLGVGFGLWKNLAIVAGGALLAVDTTSFERVDTKPGIAERDPLRTRWARAGFYGLSLKF